MIATVGLLFINTRSRYESRLHWLATVGGVISVIFCADHWQPRSMVIFRLALAIGFTLSWHKQSEKRYWIGSCRCYLIWLCLLLKFIQYEDDARKYICIPEAFLLRSFADDGRWEFFAQALRDLERYGLKGGGFTAHNSFLEIWLSGELYLLASTLC
jgi:hypothetical protein